MLQSSDVLSILERLTKLGTHLSNEDFLVVSELIKNYDLNGNTKHSTLLKLFLAYKQLSIPNKDIGKGVNINKMPIILLKEAINTIRFNELELYIPSKYVEWILLKIGQILLNNKEYELSRELFEISRDCFKLIENSIGTAISNYFLAYSHYFEGDVEKGARLLEMISSEFKDKFLKFSCQYNAALLYYKTNLKRSLNLLENCQILLEDNDTHNFDLIINKDSLEEILNKFRRDYILKHYNEGGDLFQIIEKLTISLHKKGNMLDLAASYYEAGTVFDNLNYGDTAEDYYIESARLSSEKEEWKLYSKCLIQLIIKFIERGELQNAETYLNDLSIISVQLNDEDLLKKIDTLLNSLQKLKINNHTINASTDDIENFLGSEIENESQLTVSNETNMQIDTETSIKEQELFDQFLESESSRGSNDIVSIQTDTEKIDSVELKEGPKEKDDSKPTFYSTRQQIVIKLNDRGFDTYLDMKPIKGGVTVDIVGIKGKIRKKKLYIMLAETKAEGELSANLLRTLQDSAEKIVYVFGETARKKKKKGVVFSFKMNQLVFS